MAADNGLELLGRILTILLNTTEVDSNGNVFESRRRIDIIENIKIEIYSQEHPPPHFHVKSSNINATFTIDKCELLMGDIDSKTQKKIEYFHSLNKHKLIEAWNESRPSNCPVGPITN
ncbi:MAG: DUF4160 domain-containing protein [Bacteroidota bacterium]